MTNEIQNPTRAPLRGVRPDVKVEERPEAFVLTAALPGVTREAVDVQFENGVLALRATRRSEPGREVLHREFGDVEYRASFELGGAVDATAIRAELEDGLLTLQLPKVEAARPRSIPVQVQ